VTCFREDFHLHAAGVVLRDSPGAEVELSIWQQSAIPTDPTGGFVVVGAEKAPEQLGCPYTLKLREAQGPRTVTLETSHSQ
jgi:hypothetical protein